MAKKQLTTAWFCSNCGNESSKWEGRCPACGEWNTMVEKTSAKHPVEFSARQFDACFLLWGDFADSLWRRKA